MNWKIKASVMFLCDHIPFGEGVYQSIQRRFGNLTHSPNFRLPAALKSLELLQRNGKRVEGMTLFEVGTGHLPIIPTCFFLAGAETVYTYDLNRRLQLPMLSKCLSDILAEKSSIRERFSPYVDADLFDRRMAVVEAYRDRPEDFLEKAGIRYVAPGDAAATGLPDACIDLHYSNTVFEHIPENVLHDIMREASRILKPGATALHLIDPSDHFEHQDKSISKVNFLRYSESRWSLIAGNQFAYCNRLRWPALRRVFTDNGFEMVHEGKSVDRESMGRLTSGFEVHPDFRGYSNEDLCVTAYDVLCVKPS